MGFLVTGYEDQVTPVPGCTYFIPCNGRAKLLVCVCAYNEEAWELQTTLESLSNQGVDMKVCIIMDGLTKMSDSMQDYLKGLFQVDKFSTSSSISVIQHVDQDLNLAPFDMGNGKMMDLTLLVKQQNHRKHNSHEWFLRAFAKHYKADYLFCTDTSTTFEPNCLNSLVSFLDQQESYCAATGFQCAVPSHSRGIIPWMQYSLQAFEFAASGVTTNCELACFGFQTVMPGPCQMIRASDVSEAFLELYFDRFNSESDDSILNGNMKLAEDRTFTIFLYTTCKKSIGFVPEAEFTFIVEPTTEAFFAQRRRWINGTTASVVYLLRSNDIWKDIAWWRRSILFLIIIWNLAVLVSPMVMPGILTMAALGGIDTLMLQIGQSQYSTIVSSAFVATMWLALLAFICIHRVQRYSSTSCTFAFLTQFITYALCIMTWVVLQGFTSLHIAALCGLGFMLLQNLISGVLLGKPRILMLLLCNVTQYAALSVFYNLLFFYSLARSWDLSWGNRPSAAVKSAQLVRMSWALIAAFLVVNAGSGAITVCALYFWTGTATGMYVLLAIVGFLTLKFPLSLWFAATRARVRVVGAARGSSNCIVHVADGDCIIHKEDVGSCSGSSNCIDHVADVDCIMHTEDADSSSGSSNCIVHVAVGDCIMHKD